MHTRRDALVGLAACFLAALGWTSGAHGGEEQDLVCAKPDALSEAEKRQRKLDNYTEKSPDRGKTCSGCRFFSNGAGPAACGKCEIFNGPANPKGKCDDWAARPV